MFNIEIDRTDGVAVLQCAGRFVRGAAVTALRDAVTAQKNARIVVLDLSDVVLLDGSGLGTLVVLHRWARDRQVQLKLVNPSTFILELLERTGLAGVFDVSSVLDAVMILRSPQHVSVCAAAS